MIGLTVFGIAGTLFLLFIAWLLLREVLGDKSRDFWGRAVERKGKRCKPTNGE